MFGRRIVNAAIAVSLTAAPAVAQSLGDLARQEEARRAVSKSVKTLTNADLDPSAIVAPAGAAPAEPSCFMSRSKGRCVSAEELLSTSVAGFVTKENAPSEEKWRNEAGAIRSQLQRTQNLIAALEAIVADEGRSASDKKIAEQQLAGPRSVLPGIERRWELLESAASNQNIPRRWLEPFPTLTKNQPQQ